jgi:hypothetical protein
MYPADVMVETLSYEVNLYRRIVMLPPDLAFDL